MTRLFAVALLITSFAFSANAQKLSRKERKAIEAKEIKDRNPVFASIGEESTLSISKVSLEMNVECHDLDTEPGEEHIVCFDQALDKTIASKLNATVIDVKKISESSINEDGYKKVKLEATIAR